MIQLFGTPVLKTKLQNHETIKQEFVSVLQDDQYFAPVKTWMSNVETTFGTMNNEKIPFKSFINSAVLGLNEYLDSFKVQGKVKYGIEVWLNRYKEGQFQEVHNHASNNNIVSCAYMLELPKDSGDFVFYKKNDFWATSGLRDLCAEPFPINNRVTPPMEEGDIIFFPSDLEHYVSHNKTNKRRATISANFSLTREE